MKESRRNGKVATSFADALVEMREMRGLTRSQLAYKAGLGSSTIRMLETKKRGDPQCSTLAALATALNVSADDILIKAGMKESTPTGNPGKLSPKEKEIIVTLRAIESASLRRHVLDAALELVRGAEQIDADAR